MRIDAVPRDTLSMLDLFPGASSGEVRAPLEAFRALLMLSGTEIPGPTATTVRYEGMIESRSADIPPVLQFLMDIGSGAVATVIAAWIIDRFRGRATKVTINRREVNLDDEGTVRQIVEEEIKVRRS
jgi:hypothetical protein